MLLMIVVSLLAISAITVVHELGHYLIARAYGIRTLTFSIGFGPKLFSYQRNPDSTLFQIASIPFGGFVEFHSNNPLEEIDVDDTSAYVNASNFAKMMVLFAGPLANYLFAGVFLTAAVHMASEIPFIQSIYWGFFGVPLKLLESISFSDMSVRGPIGAIDGFAKSPDVLDLIAQIGFMNLSIVVVNLLPFPPLDGGKIFVILVGLITRRSVVRAELLMSIVGAVLLFSTLIYCTYKDVVGIIDGHEVQQKEMIEEDGVEEDD